MMSSGSSAGADQAHPGPAGELPGVLRRLDHGRAADLHGGAKGLDAATLAGFGSSGMTIEHGTPYSRGGVGDGLGVVAGRVGEHPAGRSSIRARRLIPPRTLKAPVGWTFSCLT